jgi:hypothetical protein
MDERLRSVADKVQALRDSGQTEGERRAATAALERIRNGLPVSITATVMDVDRTEAFYSVRYRDVQGDWQTRKVPRELFQHPGKVVDDLLKVGADLPDDSKLATNLIHDAVRQKSGLVRYRTGRAGWYDGKSFVYPGRTFGKRDEDLLYEPCGDLDPALGISAGSLDAWRDNLRLPCKYSDYLITVLGAKAASALLDVIGEDEGHVIHLHGTLRSGHQKTGSSSGKTLAVRVAASMTGRCRKNDLATFSISETGLGDLCFARNNLGVELDEHGRSFGHGNSVAIKPDQLSYVLTSGRGTIRSKFATKQRELKNLTWLTGAITSGEIPLDGNYVKRSEGSQVRMIGVPVPPGAKGGIFNRVKQRGDKKLNKCRRLAAQVEKTINSNYGFAFPALIDRLVKDRAKIRERLRDLIENLIDKVIANDNPWERRFARKLAIAGAAAILLSELNIGPWTEKRATRAFVRIYKKSRAAIRTVEESADGFCIKARRLLTKNKVSLLPKGTKLSNKRRRLARTKGLRRELPDIGEILLLPLRRVDQLIGGGRSATSSVLEHLADQHIVVRAPDGKLTRQILIPGDKRRKRFVCFSVTALCGGK